MDEQEPRSNKSVHFSPQLVQPASTGYTASERASLLGSSGQAQGPAHSGFSSAAASPWDVSPAPQVVEPRAYAGNVVLDPRPFDYSGWPQDRALYVACGRCGHYVRTQLKAEPEMIGCSECFKQRPVFKRVVNHYCPHCGHINGHAPTGENCYCCESGGTSSLTCWSLVSWCCCD